MELKGEKKRKKRGYSSMGGGHGCVLRLCKYACLILIILGKVQLCWHHMGINDDKWNVCMNGSLQDRTPTVHKHIIM